MQPVELRVRARRPRSTRRAHPPYDVVLTAEGRAMLERKMEELRRETVPSLQRAFAEDPQDELTRSVYDDALAELRRVESVLAQARPIPVQREATDQVSLGDSITVTFLSASHPKPDATEEFLLVHPFEAPLDLRRISVASPLGRAVLGRRAGEVVTFETPSGPRAVRILDRRPQP